MDMHLIDGDGRRTWCVVLHFAVPDVNNAMGVNYRTALANSRLVDAASPSVLPDGDGNDGSISTAEKTQLINGQVYEHVASLSLDGAGVSTGSRVVALRAAYAAKETEIINTLKRRLKFFGHNETKA